VVYLTFPLFRPDISPAGNGLCECHALPSLAVDCRWLLLSAAISSAIEEMKLGVRVSRAGPYRRGWRLPRRNGRRACRIGGNAPGGTGPRGGSPHLFSVIGSGRCACFPDGPVKLSPPVL